MTQSDCPCFLISFDEFRKLIPEIRATEFGFFDLAFQQAHDLDIEPLLGDCFPEICARKESSGVQPLQDIGLSIDGAAQFAQTQNPFAALDVGSDDITITLWATPIMAAGSRTLLDTIADDRGLIISLVEGAGNSYEVVVGGSDGVTDWSWQTSGANITTSNTMIGVQLLFAKQEVAVTVDGAAVAITQTQGQGLTPLAGNGVLTFGADYDQAAGTISEHFIGVISDVIIEQRLVESDELVQRHDQGPGQPPNLQNLLARYPLLEASGQVGHECVAGRHVVLQNYADSELVIGGGAWANTSPLPSICPDAVPSALTQADKDLIDAGRKYFAYAIYSRYLSNNPNLQVGRAGIARMINDGPDTRNNRSFEFAEQGEVAQKLSYIRGLRDGYLAELMQFLADNQDTYPCLPDATTKCFAKPPSGQQTTPGAWIGGSSKRRHHPSHHPPHYKKH